jgi:hypothetical protein
VSRGPFAPLALPGFPGTTSLSATLGYPTHPSRAFGCKRAISGTYRPGTKIVRLVSTNISGHQRCQLTPVLLLCRSPASIASASVAMIYDPQAKRKLIEACLEPGISLAGLALVHGVNANLLRKWVVKHQRHVPAKAT